MQPGGSDFTPGSIFARIQNTTGAVINDVNVAYDLLFNNDQGRANSFNFGFATGGAVADPKTLNPAPVSALNFTSPEAADALGFQSVNRSTTLSGLGLADGDYLYLQFVGDDVSGVGSRDEFGIDNLSFTANIAAVPEPTTWLLLGVAGCGSFFMRRRNGGELPA